MRNSWLEWFVLADEVFPVLQAAGFEMVESSFEKIGLLEWCRLRPGKLADGILIDLDEREFTIRVTRPLDQLHAILDATDDGKGTAS